MAPSDEDVESAREWLGASHGGVELPDELVEMLIVGYEAECWALTKHVLILDNLTASKAVKLWNAILGDCADEASETPSLTTKMMFEIWIAGHFEEDDGQKTRAKYVPSKEEQTDLDAQGMMDWREMRHGEFALYIGRPGTDAEIEGGEYRTPPYEMKGVKALAKVAKDSGGFRNYDKVLADAFKTGKLEALERWFMKTGFALGKMKDPKWTRPGAVMLSHWMDARNQLKNDKALILYFKNYREDTEGRFFPRECDMKIAGVARDTYQNPELSEAYQAQMKEVLDANSELRREIQSLNSRLRTLQTTVNDGGGGPSRPGGGRPIKDREGRLVECHRCGGNHYIANCPEASDYVKPTAGGAKDKEE